MLCHVEDIINVQKLNKTIRSDKNSEPLGLIMSN